MTDKIKIVIEDIILHGKNSLSELTDKTEVQAIIEELNPFINKTNISLPIGYEKRANDLFVLSISWNQSIPLIEDYHYDIFDYFFKNESVSEIKKKKILQNRISIFNKKITDLFNIRSNNSERKTTPEIRSKIQEKKTDIKRNISDQKKREKPFSEQEAEKILKKKISENKELKEKAEELTKQFEEVNIDSLNDFFRQLNGAFEEIETISNLPDQELKQTSVRDATNLTIDHLLEKEIIPNNVYIDTQKKNKKDKSDKQAKSIQDITIEQFENYATSDILDFLEELTKRIKETSNYLNKYAKRIAKIIPFAKIFTTYLDLINLVTDILESLFFAEQKLDLSDPKIIIALTLGAVNLIPVPGVFILQEIMRFFIEMHFYDEGGITIPNTKKRMRKLFSLSENTDNDPSLFNFPEVHFKNLAGTITINGSADRDDLITKIEEILTSAIREVKEEMQTDFYRQQYA